MHDFITPPGRPSYTCGSSDVPLLGDTIGDNFDRTVAAEPRREALVEVATGRRWTYQELGAEVDALALGLIDGGVVKGDRVGIWAPNMAEWIMLQYATAKIGAILVNVNPAYRTHELEYVLKQAGISVLVSAREFKTPWKRRQPYATRDGPKIVPYTRHLAVTMPVPTQPLT